MGDHNGKVGIEQKIYILPQNMGKKNFVFLASSEHKVFFSLFCGKKYTYLILLKIMDLNDNNCKIPKRIAII